jgi:hypothetical protein
MLIRRYDPERDYKAMEAAWAAHGWTAPPCEALPRIGLVARTSQGNEFLAYLGLYAEGDGGTFGVVDWAIRNPEADADLSDHALRGLFTQIERIAEAKGIKFLYSITANDKWGTKLKSMGMITSEHGVTAYIKQINDNRNQIDFMVDGGN